MKYEFTDNQWAFITASILNPNAQKKDIATTLGLNPQTVYNWKVNRPEVDEFITHALQQQSEAALQIMSHALVRATNVYLDSLQSEDEKARLKAADAIFDRVLGKPQQRTDITTGGDSINIVFDRESVLGATEDSE